MEGKQAKALISVSDGRMEFEGSEEFVERQLAAFADLIKQSLQSAPAREPKKLAEDGEGVKSGAPASDGLAGYSHLFAKGTSGTVQVLKDIPGTSTAQKMANAARLLALANSLSGKQVTTFKEIRELCEAHGTLDKTNFAQVIKGEKADFLFDGAGKSQTVSLTVPGRKAAEKLASELNK